MTTRDYTVARVEYIRGQESLESVATRHSIPSGSLRRIADAENWTTQREQYRATMSAQTLAMAQAQDIDVRREILESFVEARRAWAESKRQADDYQALARLAASITGLDTERQTINATLQDWRAGKPPEYVEMVERLARDAQARLASGSDALIDADGVVDGASS